MSESSVRDLKQGSKNIFQGMSAAGTF